MKREDIMTKVNVELVDNACLPVYKTSGSAGADCRSRVEEVVHPGEVKLIPLGFKVEIPDGWEIQIRPRSGLALDKGITILNAPGTIDCDYRGEVGAIVYNTSAEPFYIHQYDRIAQAVLAEVERAYFKTVIKLSETERGDGGFGHTGV